MIGIEENACVEDIVVDGEQFIAFLYTGLYLLLGAAASLGRGVLYSLGLLLIH